MLSLRYHCAPAKPLKDYVNLKKVYRDEIDESEFVVSMLNIRMAFQTMTTNWNIKIKNFFSLKAQNRKICKELRNLTHLQTLRGGLEP